MCVCVPVHVSVHKGFGITLKLRHFPGLHLLIRLHRLRTDMTPIEALSWLVEKTTAEVPRSLAIGRQVFVQFCPKDTLLSLP